MTTLTKAERQARSRASAARMAEPEQVQARADAAHEDRVFKLRVAIQEAECETGFNCNETMTAFLIALLDKVT